MLKSKHIKVFKVLWDMFRENSIVRNARKQCKQP